MIKLTFLNIAIFQGIVIGLILLKSPFFKSKANRYLAFAIFSISLSLLGIVLNITQLIEQYPFLRIIENIDTLTLFPVFILLFIINQVNHPQKKSKKLRWLFVPFCISTLLITVIDTILESQANSYTEFAIYSSITLASILLLLVFLFIPFVLIKTYKYIQHSTHKKEKKWLTYLWSFEVTLLGSFLLLTSLSPFVVNEISNIIQIIALFATLLIHWIAYSGVYTLKLANEQESIKALRANQITQPKSNSAEQLPLLSHKIEVTNEQNSSLKENTYFQALEKLCTEQKIYRDSTLNRNKVAEMLGISPSYVSQIVNSVTGDNFATYINRYRIEEVKALIIGEEFNNYSLLAIGLECGFQSKTTFYNSFKKMTGMTPHAYKKSHK